VLTKPERIFSRDDDWQALVSFVENPQPEPTLGVVSGRRRQGKTFLLTALAQAAGGFYFGADEATEAEALRSFGTALASFSGIPVQFSGWDDALTYFFSLAHSRPLPLIIDEVPMLIKASPQLPSMLQRHLDHRWSAPGSPCPARMLLCGSAMSVMGGLLSGQAPLRGRAGLELIVRPLSYHEAAAFWSVTDPRLAVLLNAVIGGTPAYRRQFVRDDVPDGMSDFDSWVCRTVLNPRVPLFREARYLLAEAVPAREPGIYHSVLGAIAGGNTTNGGIASYIGRSSAEIAHPLNVLEDCGFVTRDTDIFRRGRSAYRIAEPLISFYQAVMRPQWTTLDLGGAERVWQGAKARFLAQVVGPRFEQICREWAVTSTGTFREPPGEVGTGIVADPAGKAQIQIDVAVLSPAWPGERRRVLSLGEAKWSKPMGLRHLDRLARARELLARHHLDTSATVLACFSGAGFDADLLAAESSRDDVLLVGLDRLYS
jgi:uncharacterized protein